MAGGEHPALLVVPEQPELHRLLELVLEDGHVVRASPTHPAANGAPLERATASTPGAAASAVTFGPTISGDGRFVAFESDAANIEKLAKDQGAVKGLPPDDRVGRQATRVAAALRGGIRWVQLRAKERPACELYEAACRLAPLLRLGGLSQGGLGRVGLAARGGVLRPQLAAVPAPGR